MKVVSLKKRSEFKLLFKEGKRVYQEHFNIVYLRLPALREQSLIGQDGSPHSSSSRMLGARNKDSSKRTIDLVDTEHSNKINDLFEGSSSVLDPRIREDDGGGGIKIAYVVSKKVSGKAVVRNRIKRRLRVAVRLILTEQELKGNASLLIAIRPSDKIIEASFQQICLEVKKSFEQLLR